MIFYILKINVYFSRLILWYNKLFLNRNGFQCFDRNHFLSWRPLAVRSQILEILDLSNSIFFPHFWIWRFAIRHFAPLPPIHMVTHFSGLFIVFFISSVRNVQNAYGAALLFLIFHFNQNIISPHFADLTYLSTNT